MFPKKTLLSYGLVLLLRFLLVFGVILAALVGFFVRPSVWSGMIVFFPCFTELRWAGNSTTR
jgi:hypothetical protein